MRVACGRGLLVGATFCLLLLGGAAIAFAQSATAFGFAGTSLGVLVPDLEPVNAFLSAQGYPLLSGVIVIGGGRGRGGVKGGVSVGGFGWCGVLDRESEGQAVDLVLGYGAVELGHVAGGDERSLLTLGVAIGGGGLGLALRDAGTTPSAAASTPAGIVPTPVDRSAGRVLLGVEPFISMQVQPLAVVGFELRFGWLIPLLGVQWSTPLGALAGLPPLDLGGPVVTLSLTWGGMSTPADREEDTETTTRHIVPFDGGCLEIDNPVGFVSVTTRSPDVSPEAERSVEVFVTRHARSPGLREEIAVAIEPAGCGLRIVAEGPRRWGWSVDYEVTVPASTEVRITQGAGDVHLARIDAAAHVDLGAGEVIVDGFLGTELTVDCGVGDVSIAGPLPPATTVSVGTGDIELTLPEAASATVTARVGVGDITVGPFAGRPEESRAGFGSDLVAVFGDGSSSIDLSAGVGSVIVRPEAE